MSNKFTYVIRSSSKLIGTENTNNCSMRLNGLPSQYKYYDCTVAAFYVDTQDSVFTTSTIELKVEGIDILNGLDSKGGRLNTLAFASLNNIYPQGKYTFRCSNFNGRTIRFKLFDDTNNILQSDQAGSGSDDYNLGWVLILNIEGVLE